MEKFYKFSEKFSLMSIFTLIIGILLIVHPYDINAVICYLISFSLIFSGVKGFILDRRVHHSTPKKIWFIVLISLGAVVAFQKELIISIIPILFALYLLVSGLGSAHDYFVMNKLNYEKKTSSVIFTVLKILFAICILNNPFSTALMLFRFIGVCLVIDAVTNFASVVNILQAEKAFEKAEAELRDMNLSKNTDNKTENIEVVEAEIVDVEQPIVDADDE